MINALVQNGEKAAIIELPLDMLSLRYDLSQIGIRTPPKDIPISDDEDQPISAKLFADSDIGNSLAVLFNSRHSLEEANMCAHMVENAHPAIWEGVYFIIFANNIIVIFC